MARQCSCPQYRALTGFPHPDNNKSLKTGEAAHIYAVATGGEMHIESQTPEQRKDIGNGIWMCGTHARKIDKDAEKYPTEVLRNWNEEHEKWLFNVQYKPRLPKIEFVNIMGFVINRFYIAKITPPNKIRQAEISKCGLAVIFCVLCPLVFSLSCSKSTSKGHKDDPLHKPNPVKKREMLTKVEKNKNPPSSIPHKEIPGSVLPQKLSKQLRRSIHPRKCPSSLESTSLSNFICFPFLNLVADRFYSGTYEYKVSEREAFLKELFKGFPGLTTRYMLFVTEDLHAHPKLFGSTHLVFRPNMYNWRKQVSAYFGMKSGQKAYSWKYMKFWGDTLNSAIFSQSNFNVELEGCEHAKKKNYPGHFAPYMLAPMISYTGPMKVLLKKKLPMFTGGTLNVEAAVRFPITKHLDLVLVRGGASAKINLELKAFNDVNYTKDTYDVLFPLLSLDSFMLMRWRFKDPAVKRANASSRPEFNGLKEYTFHESAINFKLTSQRRISDKKNLKPLVFYTYIRVYLIWRKYDVCLMDSSLQTPEKSYEPSYRNDEG
ncbi:MAG: hypothetical protein KJ630_19990 [Proteobacteria bacterium]|nr:hypothetical protein [Pseudomonadota bacterium]